MFYLNQVLWFINIKLAIMFIESMKKLEIVLKRELVEKMDTVVELLVLDSRDELIQCALRRYVDNYFIAPSITA